MRAPLLHSIPLQYEFKCQTLVSMHFFILVHFVMLFLCIIIYVGSLVMMKRPSSASPLACSLRRCVHITVSISSGFNPWSTSVRINSPRFYLLERYLFSLEFSLKLIVDHLDGLVFRLTREIVSDSSDQKA